jgi:hypothetical protein
LLRHIQVPIPPRLSLPGFRETARAQPVAATPPNIKLLSKGRVETRKAFCGAEDRRVEGGTVVASDWAELRQEPCVRSLFVVATRWDCPGRSRRSLLTLTQAEREDISRGLVCGSSIRDLTKGLQRATSSVSGRWCAMVAVRCIEPMKRISKPESRPCGPRRAFLLSTASCRRSLRVN